MADSEKLAKSSHIVNASLRGRVVIIGRNAKVIQEMTESLDHVIDELLVISHSEIATFESQPGDQVWIFSFSRKPQENRDMFKSLRNWKYSQFHYISTATANVTSITSCYEYPRIKRQAELDCLSILGASIVRIGLFYRHENQIPAGSNACTHVDELIFFIAHNGSCTKDEEGILHLYEMKDAPFSSSIERACFLIYGKLLSVFGAHPCALRPFDFILRARKWRWYGYLYLSNRICLLTT